MVSWSVGLLNYFKGERVAVTTTTTARDVQFQSRRGFRKREVRENGRSREEENREKERERVRSE